MKLIVGMLLLFSLNACARGSTVQADARITAYVTNAKKSELRFYLKDDKGELLKSFERLSRWLKTKNMELLFAMNGGMYMENSMPLGLYIEDGEVIKEINRVQAAPGNFYMQPNGVFFITKGGDAHVEPSSKFRSSESVRYATQSGPMLVIDGEIHPKFGKRSASVHIRNGVGVLPNGDILFAISRQRINLYEFANFFRKSGCKNALYLDGAISKIYSPPQQRDLTDSRFGVMIAVVKRVEPR